MVALMDNVFLQSYETVKAPQCMSTVQMYRKRGEVLRYEAVRGYVASVHV